MLTKRWIQFWMWVNGITAVLALGYIFFDLQPAIDPAIGHTRWSADPIHNFIPAALAFWSMLVIIDGLHQLKKLDSDPIDQRTIRLTDEDNPQSEE